MRIRIFTFSLMVILFMQLSCKDRKVNKESNKEAIWNRRVLKINKRKSVIDSINKSKQWKKLKCGLWKSKNGDLGLKTAEGNEQGIDIDRYITELCCDGQKLNEVIDTLTFRYLGSSFYKDKHHIYTHYLMTCGGNFWIVEEADLKTFKVIGDCYARDKNNIYGEREMVMKNVDYKTFKTKKGIGCFAKDKNGYYFWDEKIELKHLKDSIIEKAISELDAL